MKQYITGIYRDTDGQRVLQVVDDVDCLSCEILADPGVGYSQFNTVKDMLASARMCAKFLMCKYLEINCAKGNGSYQWCKVS